MLDAAQNVMFTDHAEVLLGAQSFAISKIAFLCLPGNAAGMRAFAECKLALSCIMLHFAASMSMPTALLFSTVLTRHRLNPGCCRVCEQQLPSTNYMLLLQDINKDSVNKEDQSAYWYQRYSLRPLLDAQGNVTLAHTGAAVHDVPLFLEEAKDSILMTGKYLNAIRECGRPVERPLPPDVHIGRAAVPEHDAGITCLVL